MAVTAAQLLAIVAVRGADEAAVKLLGVGASADSAGEKLGRLAAGGAILAGVGFVALGAHVVKMAADFQQSMTLLVTSANESQGNLKMVGNGILQMSVDTATGADKLSSAMFTTESAGYHGAAGLAVLKAAAEGAKIENADLDQVTQALTTTMHDWREPANQAIDIMNSFREAAALGNMRMDDFVGAMKNVGPVASLAKIPLTDIEAALSTMSLEGDKGASAGTHLAQSLLNMISPSTKAQKVLKEIGLTAQQVSDDMQKSLPDTLKEITDDIGKKFPKGSEAYNHALSDMFGGTRGLKAILELTGANLKDFTKDASDLAPIMKQNANNVDGWALVQQNLNFKLDKAKEAVNALFINIGTQLFPVLGKLLDQVTPLITQFGDWIVKSNAITVATQNTANAIQASIGVVQSIIGFYQQWQPEIQTTAAALTFFFIPALIKSGVEAVISAAKITYSYITSVIASGFAGWSVVFKIAAYTGALIASGYQAVVSAGKITYNFIASMIASGYQAVVTASVITYNFIASLIASGVQAIIAAGKIAVTFVGSLVSAAGEATISAGIIDASIIPAITGVGVAATIAAGPIIALGAIAVATFALIANRAWDFNRQVQTSTNETVNVAQLRYHQLATGASTDMGNMKTNVTNAANTMKTNVTNSANQTKKDVDTAFTTMAQQTYSNTLTLSDNAVANFQNLNGDLISQMTTIDANIIGYWNDVANYIDKHPINGHVVYTTAGGGIGVQQSATTAHNAEGTDYWQGGPTWIGERGPEILNLPRGSQIIPNNKIGQATSGGGGATHLHVDVYLDGTRMTGQLMPRIVQQIRQATGAKF